MTAPPERRNVARREGMVIPAGEDVLDYARRLGWRRTLLRSVYVGVNQLVPCSIFTCVQLGPQDVNDALLEKGGGYERRFLAAHEVDRLAADLDPAMVERVREAVALGDACYVVLDRGRLANIGLFTDRPAPLAGDLVVHFDPPSWYMYGAFTPAAYRGRRLHAIGVLGGAVDLFAHRGVSGLVSVYELTNYRSMVSALRMGWRRRGALYRLGSGRWMRVGRTAQARALGMRLEAAPVP